jgi:hypothetical protein
VTVRGDIKEPRCGRLDECTVPKMYKKRIERGSCRSPSRIVS